MRASPGPPARLGAFPPGLVVVAAAWSVQQLPALAPQGAGIALLAGGAALLPLGRIAILLASACIGAGWAMLQAVWALDQRLPAPLEGRDLVVIGVVDQLPQASDRGLRFRFRIERCVAPAGTCPAPVAVRIAWYRGFASESAHAPPAIRPGQRWQLNLRLRRPHATLNPGLFDAELRALEEGIAANGHVRRGGAEHPNRLIDPWVLQPRAALERLRAALRERMSAALASQSPEVRGVLIALVIGDQAAIPSVERQESLALPKSPVQREVDISAVSARAAQTIKYCGAAVSMRATSDIKVLRLPARYGRCVTLKTCGE